MNTTTAKNRILSLALCLALTMTLYLPGPVEVRAAGTEIKVNTLTADTNGAGWNYDHSNKALFLNGPGPFILTGTSAELGVVVNTPTVEITMRDVNITSNSMTSAYTSALSCRGNTVILTLEGSNFLQGSNHHVGCGIRTDSASLTITGSGSLEASAGGGLYLASSGIGTMGDTTTTVGEITITGNAQVTATGRNGAAGIGGGLGSIGGGTVAITGNARVTATGSGNVLTGGYDIGGRANDGGSLYVGDGAFLELTNRGTNVDPGDLQIGECAITDNTGTYTGTYHWLLVEDGTLDPTAVEPFWLTNGAAGRQIIQAGKSVTVNAGSGFAQWYTSGNITLADPVLDPVTFTMPSDNAWIAYTNLSRPLSVNPGALSLDLDSNLTGTVTLDMGINDSDGISPAATEATAVSSDPAVADVEYGPHTGNVTITAKGPGDATVTFTFNDSAATALPVTVNVAGSLAPGPSVSTTSLELETGESDTFFVSLGEGYNGAESATITSNNTSFATVAPPSLGQSDTVTVTGVARGNATISIGYSGGSRHGKFDFVQVHVTDPDNGNGDNGNGDGGGSASSGSSSSRSSSGGSSTPDGQRTKTTLPANAFSWDGRTLTIAHDSVTPLGLQSVRWNGYPLTRDVDYSVYSGSVIVRFSEDFMAAQSPGTHTVRVEFLNHTGEATVSVGAAGTAGASDDLFDNDTHNPNTGGDSRGGMNAADNPNTGGGRGIWTALLVGSLGGFALTAGRRISIKQ